MKTLELTGAQLIIIHTVVLRQNEGIGLQNLPQLLRIIPLLHLDKPEDIVPEGEYDIQLEDADFSFLQKEWNSFNAPDKAPWRRNIELLVEVSKVNELLNKPNVGA